jgi:putative DNA primase/helicase
MGTALHHLSKSEIREIVKNLFDITSEDTTKGELHGLCPLHDEQNPSFSYNFKKDQYYCFACGCSGDLIKLWSKVKGYSNKIGFKAFCREFDIKPDTRKASVRKLPGSKTEALEMAWRKMKPLPESWIKQLEEKRGWSKEIIEKLDIRMQTCFRDKKGRLVQIQKPDRVAIPIRDRKDKLVNIRLYKPGARINKMLSWGKGFGAARLFPPAPLNKSGPVVLCEGEADTLCALSRGLNAITQTAKRKIWPYDHFQPLSDCDVIIAYDADQDGQDLMKLAAENLEGRASTVKLLEWPDFMGRRAGGSWPKSKGQDLTDYFVEHKQSVDDFNALCDQAIKFRPEKISSNKIFQLFFQQGLNGRWSYKPILLAEKLLSDISLLMDPRSGLLYRYNDQFWEVLHEDHIAKICLEYLGIEAKKNRVLDALYQIKKKCTLPDGRELNDYKNMVCVNNGMLHLKTLKLKPHDKRYLSTYKLNVDFDPDAGMQCDRFLQFLDENVQTEGAIAQLQEFAGYCLTRDTRYAKFLLLLGPGSDGKSTFLMLLKELVGSDNCSAVSFKDLEDQFHRSSLYNKLLNISTEVGSRALESSYFKAITTGDLVSAAFKHQNVFTFNPYCKLAFAANKLPRVLDNSYGFFRRILPVRFKRQFITDADPRLSDKLKDELSGIFYWAIIGLHRLWTQEGFTDCDETRSLMMEYNRFNNPVLCFIEDKCEVGENCNISKTDLYDNYRSYCSEGGYIAKNREGFFKELYSALSNLKTYRPRKNGLRQYRISGICMNQMAT